MEMRDEKDRVKRIANHNHAVEAREVYDRTMEC
jgi:hypothetical protein